MSENTGKSVEDLDIWVIYTSQKMGIKSNA